MLAIVPRGTERGEGKIPMPAGSYYGENRSGARVLLMVISDVSPYTKGIINITVTHPGTPQHCWKEGWG